MPDTASRWRSRGTQAAPTWWSSPSTSRPTSSRRKFPSWRGGIPSALISRRLFQTVFGAVYVFPISSQVFGRCSGLDHPRHGGAERRSPGVEVAEGRGDDVGQLHQPGRRWCHSCRGGHRVSSKQGRTHLQQPGDSISVFVSELWSRSLLITPNY